jgi:hypothetical protein
MNVSYKNGLLSIGLGIVAAFLIINIFFRQEPNFAELALGEETKAYLATDSLGHPIHLVHDSLSQLLLTGWQKRGKNEVALVLGNSQTHSINQLKEGDQTYVGLLHQKWRPRKLDVVAHTIPNANLQELYLLFRYWQTKLPVTTVLVPVFMDDLREDGIRDVFLAQLLQTKFQIEGDTSEVVRQINKTLASLQSNQGSSADNDFKALEQTVQESVEKHLNDFLQQHFSSWGYRPNVRGQLFANLHVLRNTAFGISASTKRKMIPARMKNNYAALERLLTFAQAHKIKVLLYVPPIRSDVPIPYDEAEYMQFKREVELMAKQHGALFANLEQIVPGNNWGSKNATTIDGGKTEIDYMHFQYPGHQLLADSLDAQLFRQ